jgi:hypothetical protein
VAEVVVLEKRVPVKNGGRVARADSGAARWRERVLAFGLPGRARRIKTLIPRQRDLGSCCTDSSLRSAETLRSLLALSDDVCMLGNSRSRGSIEPVRVLTTFLYTLLQVPLHCFLINLVGMLF